MPLLTYLLLWSVVLQAFLAIILLLKMRGVRVRAFKETGISYADIAVNHEAWPENVRKVQNNYNNQFELPVLFYLACTLVMVFGIESWFFVIVSAVFVISRYVHMFIHTGSNHVKKRFRAFLVGMVCVIVQLGYILFIATTAYLQGI